MNPNLGYLFHKQYFSPFSPEDWRAIAQGDAPSDAAMDQWEAILKSLTAKIEKIPGPELESPQNFILSTTYPGLLTGGGQPHGLGLINEFSLGFQFDPTTGLPLLPASGVKGVLRAAFPKEGAPHAAEKQAYILELLKQSEKPELDAAALALEIFEGNHRGKPLPAHQRDIFFDAVPAPATNIQLMGEDFITPHKSPFKDPLPIRFIKVMPGVKFIFRFDLKPSRTGGLSPEEKRDLFREILQDQGAGAKTRVGYGQFSPP